MTWRKRKELYITRLLTKSIKSQSNNKKNHLQTNENGDVIENEQLDDEVDELEFLLYFKTCLVDRDIEILKIRLSQSIEMREKLIKKKDTVFHKMFPFYFIQPTLVSFLWIRWIFKIIAIITRNNFRFCLIKQIAWRKRFV